VVDDEEHVTQLQLPANVVRVPQGRRLASRTLTSPACVRSGRRGFCPSHAPSPPERRYALREIKARLHQASFRDAVLSAYGGRCAISHLPESRLLDAAHIVMDADEQLGQPVVSNSPPPSKYFCINYLLAPSESFGTLLSASDGDFDHRNVTVV
jgi:hypothetical protein